MNEPADKVTVKGEVTPPPLPEDDEPGEGQEE